MISLTTPGDYDPTQTTIAAHLVSTSQITIKSTMRTSNGNISITTSFETGGLGRIKMIGKTNSYDGWDLSMVFMSRENGGSGLRNLFSTRRGRTAPNQENLRDAFQHITWQALSTILYGEEFAKEVGDAHERDKSGPWALRNAFLSNGASERLLRLSLVDLVNNEYGRQLGLSLSEDFSIERLSTPEGMTDFLNEVVDNMRTQFPELGGNGPMFRTTDRAVQEAVDVAERER